jgi:hypothetical protein
MIDLSIFVPVLSRSPVGLSDSDFSSPGGLNFDDVSI